MFLTAFGILCVGFGGWGLWSFAMAWLEGYKFNDPDDRWALNMALAITVLGVALIWLANLEFFNRAT